MNTKISVEKPQVYDFRDETVSLIKFANRAYIAWIKGSMRNALLVYRR